MKYPIYSIDCRARYYKQINDCSLYIFSIIIVHIENHPQEWEIFLDNEEALLERKFEVLDED